MEKNNKRFLAIIFIVFVLMLAISIAAIEKEEKTLGESLEKLPEISSIIQIKKPLEGIKILIDAGHGGFDSGSIGLKLKVQEKQLNLLTALELKKQLEYEGAVVEMTRSEDKALGSTKDEDMQKRALIIASSDADAMISIHMNKFSDVSVNGPQVFSYPEAEDSRLLAQAIQKRMNEALKPQNEKAARQENYLVLRSGKAPAVIVECGFLSNEREEMLLNTAEYRTEVAKSIVLGIKEFFGEEKIEGKDFQGN